MTDRLAAETPGAAIGPTAALMDVLAERKRQDERWGEQEHQPVFWAAVLAEECGEFAREAIADAALAAEPGGVARCRAEAVQAAAVALAIVECLDRGVWMQPAVES
jgi:hypothetical protein